MAKNVIVYTNGRYWYGQYDLSNNIFEAKKDGEVKKFNSLAELEAFLNRPAVVLIGEYVYGVRFKEESRHELSRNPYPNEYTD